MRRCFKSESTVQEFFSDVQLKVCCFPKNIWIMLKLKVKIIILSIGKISAVTRQLVIKV